MNVESLTPNDWFERYELDLLCVHCSFVGDSDAATQHRVQIYFHS